MPLNPLAPTSSGIQIPGMNTRPYPSLGPAQGGVGPGADQSQQPEEQKQDNVANLARLMAIMGINPANPTEAAKVQGFLMGLGLPSAKRIADQSRSRGITEIGGDAAQRAQMGQQPPQPPQAPQPMPPMGAQPMQPGRPF